MQSEWPAKYPNDTKRSRFGQKQLGFYLTKQWTEWVSESLRACLIFVSFACFAGKSSALIRLRSPKSQFEFEGGFLRLLLSSHRD